MNHWKVLRFNWLTLYVTAAIDNTRKYSYYIVFSISASSKYFVDTRQGETSSAILPYFHSYGMLIMLHCLRAGVRQVSLLRFEQEAFLKIVQDYKVLRFIMPGIE